MKAGITNLLIYSTHVAVMLPLVMMVYALFAGQLGVNPIQELTRRTGLTALIVLLTSLACSPLANLFGLRSALRLRRPLGLYAFFYASFHLLLFIWVDYRFDFEFIWLDIREKPYIYAGGGAFLILLALAITSYPYWKRRLGKKWKRLHRLVYLASGLVALHYAWIKKADLFRLTGEVTGPLIAISGLALLLVLRLPIIRSFFSRLRD
jgi:sulfoxide reductase heme-binding subunit YedZ